MEVAPLGDVQLPPGQCMGDILCVCFHPTLPSAYVALQNRVVEYDMLTGGEIGVVPLRMVPQKIVFLASRNALVVCMVDGSVDVVDIRDGHILAEHHPSKPADARPFADCELFAPAGGGFSYLYFARTRSAVVQAINLFSQNKKPLAFTGHKQHVNCVAVHHNLPLMACAAVDGTVRLFLMRSAGLYNVLESEKEEGGAKMYCKLAFHRGGSEVVAGRGGGKKEKSKKLKAVQFYKDLRLLLASEHSLITYYDVSIPGAPNKLRSFYTPGSTFRGAHFHSFRDDLVFCLDHKGRYLALWADPSLEQQVQTPDMAVQGGGKKRTAASFKANTKAFSILEEYENIRPMQLKVAARRAAAGGGDAENPTLRGVNCVMHPGAEYFIFYGSDMAAAAGRTLKLYHLDSFSTLAAGVGYGLNCGRGAALPLNTTISTPVPYWYQPSRPQANSTVDGAVYSLSLRGNNGMVVARHSLAEGGGTAELCVFTPRTPAGAPMSHCSPLSLAKAPAAADGSQTLYVSVLHNGREGKFLPYYAAVTIGADGTVAQKPAKMHAGIASGALGNAPVVVADYGKQLSLGERAVVVTGMRVASVFVVGEGALVVQCNEASGRTRVRRFAGWEEMAGRVGGERQPASPKPATPGAVNGGAGDACDVCIDLDAEELVTEVADCPGGGLVAISTTRRVLVARNDPAFHTLCAHAAPRVHSLHWVGSCLVFVTKGNMFSLTPHGATDRITSLPYHSSIAAVLYDRIVVCTLDCGVASLWSKHANHFGTLCRGALSRPDARQVLLNIVPKYDCRHATPSLLQLLCRKGYADLASTLAQQSKLAVNRNVFIEAVVGRGAAVTAGWLTKCRLHMVAGDLASAVAAFATGVREMEEESSTPPAAAGAPAARRGSVSPVPQGAGDAVAAGASPPVFLEVGAALLQLGQRLQERRDASPSPSAAEIHALCSEVVSLVDAPAALIGCLRTAHDAAAIRFAAALLRERGGSSTAALGALADAAADACGAAPRQLPLLQDAAIPRPPAAWRTGTELQCVTHLAGALGALPPIAAKSIRSYLWSGGGAGLPAAAAGGAAGGAGGAAEAVDGDVHEGAGDDGDSDDSGDDDGALQVFGADAPGMPEEMPADGDENEDEIAKQQEELRRQYLNSIAGVVDADGDDDDDDSFGNRGKVKKFEIKKEAIVQQPALNKITISMPFPGMPGAGGDGGGDGKGGEDAPPPAYLGTNAPDCLKKGIEKFERGKYDDAARRFHACLTYLKADSTQVAKKTPLVQAVQYILSCHLLKEIKTTDEEDFKSLAVLSYLVAKQPLQKKHQLMCVKKAVKANLVADNYGLIRDVVSQLEDTEAFEDDLKACTEMADANDMPAAADLTADGGPHFCWTTYEIFTSDATLMKCTYCPATFAPKTQDAGAQCSFCKYGVAE